MINIIGFIPVRGSSAFSGTGGESVSTVSTHAVSVTTSWGCSCVTAIVAAGFGAASNITRDSLRGSGALNSESASVHSVIVIHLSESALITVIVYASPDSRRSVRLTNTLMGLSRIPVRLSTLMFVPSDCLAIRSLTDSITIFCVKSIRICVSSSTVIPLRRREVVSVMTAQDRDGVSHEAAHIKRGVQMRKRAMILFRKIRDFILQKR